MYYTRIVSSQFETLESILNSATYNDTKGKHIRRTAHAILRMGFRATPHPIPCQFIANTEHWRYIVSIFNAGKLDLSDFNSIAFIFPDRNDNTYFHVWTTPATIQELII